MKHEILLKKYCRFRIREKHVMNSLIGGGGGHKLKIEDFKIIIHYKPHFGRIY